MIYFTFFFWSEEMDKIYPVDNFPSDSEKDKDVFLMT